MQKVNFNDWTLDKVDEAFGTQQSFHSEALQKWLAFSYNISAYEKKYLLQLQQPLIWGGDSWNEIELENKFISPLIMFSEIDSVQFSYFLERDINVIIDDYEINGRVDGMIASGFRNPKKPFFCMKEYKRQTDPNGDPKGQCLIAMLAAQKINDNHHPIYGCYIIGKTWCFMILEGKTYTMSNFFPADDEDIFNIYRILKGLKVNILEIISEINNY